MSAKRILIIDDSEAMRIVLSAELEGEGYAVDTTPNLREGLAKLGRLTNVTDCPFDMVIAETFTEGVKEGGVGTNDFLETFAGELRPCPLVVLTTFSDLKNAIDSKKYGADEFISKPYDLVDLLTTIERVFDTQKRTALV